MKNDITKKQLSIGQILSESWNIFTNHFVTILLVTLIVYIPIDLILAKFNIGDDFSGFGQYYRVSSLLEGLFGILAVLAIIFIVQSATKDKEMSLGEAFNKAFGRWIYAIGTSIIFGIFILGLSLLLVVPGIIYYVYWIFVIQIVALKDRAGLDALNYSKSIVTGRWWTVFGYALVFGLLSLIVPLIATFPFDFIPDIYLTRFLGDITFDIVYSFFIVVSAVFFLNFDATKLPEQKKSK